MMNPGDVPAVKVSLLKVLFPVCVSFVFVSLVTLIENAMSVAKLCWESRPLDPLSPLTKAITNIYNKEMRLSLVECAMKSLLININRDLHSLITRLLKCQAYSAEIYVARIQRAQEAHIITALPKARPQAGLSWNQPRQEWEFNNQFRLVRRTSSAVRILSVSVDKRLPWLPTSHTAQS